MGRFSLRRRKRQSAERGIATVTDYALASGQFGYAGNTYAYHSGYPAVTTTQEPIKVAMPVPDLTGNAAVLRANSVVASCVDIRLNIFSATRFQWQTLRGGRPSKLYGDPALSILERPWAGGTTQDLLRLMLLDADLAGNSYWAVESGELVRLRPDWVEVVLSPILSENPDDTIAVVGYRPLAYVYTEGGGQSGMESKVYLREEVAHFMPRVDPLAPWRGMSWLTPLVRAEIESDMLMTEHKKRFMENAATPNLAVKFPKELDPVKAKQFAAMFHAEHGGVENTGKSVVIGGGADLTVIGKDFKEISFAAVQGAGETRIAAAAGVPPVIVGLSEGLQAATYSNYAQARRRFADGTIHPLWQLAAGTLEGLVRRTGIPGSIRLWYDARDVPFLREDNKDSAEIQFRESQTIRSLIDSGHTPESVHAAVQANDWSLLEHTGLYSVQLQPPGTQASPVTEPEE